MKPKINKKIKKRKKLNQSEFHKVYFGLDNSHDNDLKVKRMNCTLFKFRKEN